MISGHVSDDGVPIITLVIDGEDWQAVVDTGFNGDLELPNELQGKLREQAVGRVQSTLAGGQVVEEDAYMVEFPFDGRVLQAIATFVDGSQILIGTNLMCEYELQIRFISRRLRLERE